MGIHCKMYFLCGKGKICKSGNRFSLQNGWIYLYRTSNLCYRVLGIKNNYRLPIDLTLHCT